MECCSLSVIKNPSASLPGGKGAIFWGKFIPGKKSEIYKESMKERCVLCADFARIAGMLLSRR
jgi:hypothetical protein